MCALSRYERVSEVTRSRASLASVSDVPDLDKPQSRDGDDEGAEVEASRKRAGMDGVGGGGHREQGLSREEPIDESGSKMSSWVNGRGPHLKIPPTPLRAP